MTTARDDAVLKVADLVGRPGASRRVDLAMAAPEDLELPLAEFFAPIRLEGVVESVVDGLLVRGRVSADTQLSCARCLTDLRRTVAADVVELFKDLADLSADVPPGEEAPVPDDEDDVIDPGYEIVDGFIDLDTLVRDALVPALPYQPLCRAECQGLCATCGVNRNERTCSCEDRDVDPRWSALERLRLPDS